MTTTPTTPDVPAALLSRAAHQLAALASRERMAALAVVLGRDGAEPCSMTELAAALGTDLRTASRHAAALEGAGLVRIRQHRVSLHVEALAETAAALVAALPLSALLEEEPDLARFASHGRLVSLPQLARVDERRRLAGLVVRLLPRDQSLSEATVNAVLAEVMDDVAALRRFLVEEGRLTRRGAEDYRRVDA